jgi:myo-inositol catabolism protein IolC
MAKKLYILPFDHRTSFIKMLGFSEKDLTSDQAIVVADYKHLIYEGFLLALKMGVSLKDAAILVDERFGAKILTEAAKEGITRIMPVEKSGQAEFDLEYAENFEKPIKEIKPEYVKVLVRYNPDGNKELNDRQISKLKIISDFCRQNKYRFLFELLIEPYLQAETMAKSIVQLQEAGIEPDIWKLEALEKNSDMAAIVKQAQSGGRKSVGVVVTDQGEGGVGGQEQLAKTAGIPGVVGFAVGRAVFKQALLDYHEKTINRDRAVKIIADNYKSFVDFFEAAQK